MVTALLDATNSWALNIDRGLIDAVVFLDLKKAFVQSIMLFSYPNFVQTEFME